MSFSGSTRWSPAVPASEAIPSRHTKLLVGLFPSRNVQIAIGRYRQQWWWPRGREFPPLDRLHLTLGYVEDHEEAHSAKRLIEALSHVRMQRLELLLDQAGTWRNDVSVIQPAPHAGLRELRESVWRAIRQARFVDQVRIAGWKPHITIARKSERAACPVLSPIRWSVDEVRVVRSHFGKDKSLFRHERLASISERDGLRMP